MLSDYVYIFKIKKQAINLIIYIFSSIFYNFCMDKLRKYLEISFFIVINLIFGFHSIFLWVGSILFAMISYITGINFAIQEEYDFLFIIISFAVCLFYLFLKFLLFPLFYSKKKLFPNIYSFFNEIFATTQKKLMVFLLVILMLIIDFLCFLFLENVNFWESVFLELVLGLGLLPSYVVMYIYLKLKNKKQSSN